MARTGVILAAGFGSRLRTGQDDALKPLTPVAGVPLLSRALRSLERAGAERIAVVVGYGSEAIEAAVAKAPSIVGVPVETVHNAQFALKNGVSLLCARAVVGDEFVVTMADHVLGDEVMDRAREHTPPAGGATLLVDRRVDAVFDLDDATKVLERDGLIVEIGKTLEAYNCIDTGVFVCTDALMAALSERYDENGDVSLSEGVAALAAAGKMGVLDIGDGFWQDVDTPQMLAHADAELRRLGQ